METDSFLKDFYRFLLSRWGFDLTESIDSQKKRILETDMKDFKNIATFVFSVGFTTQLCAPYPLLPDNSRAFVARPLRVGGFFRHNAGMNGTVCFACVRRHTKWDNNYSEGKASTDMKNVVRTQSRWSRNSAGATISRNQHATPIAGAYKLRFGFVFFVFATNATVLTCKLRAGWRGTIQKCRQVHRTPNMNWTVAVLLLLLIWRGTRLGFIDRKLDGRDPTRFHQDSQEKCDPYWFQIARRSIVDGSLINQSYKLWILVVM